MADSGWCPDGLLAAESGDRSLAHWCATFLSGPVKLNGRCRGLGGLKPLTPHKLLGARRSLIVPKAQLPTTRIYEPSPRHCEPITAETPGVKCPPWSVAVAQELLNKAKLVGGALQATENGVGFVGRLTLETAEGQVWHGYPEAWDAMDPDLKKRWLAEKVISKRDLRTYKTRRQVRDAFGGRLVGR